MKPSSEKFPMLLIINMNLALKVGPKKLLGSTSETT